MYVWTTQNRSRSMTGHTLRVMSFATVWRILHTISYSASLYVVLCTCCVSARQPCFTNPTVGEKFFTIHNCNDSGLPELPTFPDVRRWNIVTEELIKLVEDCLPEETTTTELPSSTTESTSTPITATTTEQSGTVKSTPPITVTTYEDASTEQSTPTTGSNISTTTATPTPGDDDENDTDFLALYIVLGAAGGILVVLATAYGIVYLVRKKKESKVHSETKSDEDKPANNSGAQGKLTVQKYHDRGTLVLEPIVAPQTNVPSCHASPALWPNSTDQHIDSSPTPPIGGKVITTPHVPDPVENEDTRNRTFSTGSQAGDTSILMPQDSVDTSQPEPKKKRKKKKKRESKNIELSPTDSKPANYDQVETNEEGV